MGELMREIPRHELQRLCAKYGYDQLIIVGTLMVTKNKIGACVGTFSKDGTKAKILQKMGMILKNAHLRMFQTPFIIEDAYQRLVRDKKDA